MSLKLCRIFLKYNPLFYEIQDYSSFSDAKFRQIAFTTSYAFQDAVQSWNTITKELSRLGSVSETYRAPTCDPEAGIIGCGLIDYSNDKTACDWAHRLEAIVNQVALKCNAEWIINYMAYLSVLRFSTCDELRGTR